MSYIQASHVDIRYALNAERERINSATPLTFRNPVARTIYCSIAPEDLHVLGIDLSDVSRIDLPILIRGESISVTVSRLPDAEVRQPPSSGFWQDGVLQHVDGLARCFAQDGHDDLHSGFEFVDGLTLVNLDVRLYRKPARDQAKVIEAPNVNKLRR